MLFDMQVIPSFVSSAGDVSAPHLGPGHEPSVLSYTEIRCQPKVLTLTFLWLINSPVSIRTFGRGR